MSNTEKTNAFVSPSRYTQNNVIVLKCNIKVTNRSTNSSSIVEVTSLAYPYKTLESFDRREDSCALQTKMFLCWH